MQASNSERTQWYIYVHSQSMPTLVSLVLPHLHPSFYYKLEGYINL